MNFYKTFYFITLLLPTAFLHNQNLRIINSGSAPPSVCTIGLEFFVKLNNTSNEDFHVELIPDECCLKVDDGVDCDSLQIIGECSEVIPKETTKTLNLVAPLIDPFERMGYCIINIDSRLKDRRRNIMRDTINIQFDTRIKENNNFELKHCKNIDENPLNDCKPVNCETHYNGRKSYFDKHTKRCIEVPHCVDKKNKSNQVYDPNNNKCVNEEIINGEDIEFIKSLSEKERHAKDILIINTVNRPMQNFTDEETFKELKMLNDTKTLFRGQVLCQAVTQYLVTNKYTLIILFLIVTVQCCLIMIMIYCFTNRSACKEKKVVRKFFNYRQDASVITPLIATSNMDTDTTEFDYLGESMNIDQKVKCYKACEKKKANTSMSDDILLKCLNRRDWNAKPKAIIKDTITPDVINKDTVVEINNENEIKRESFKTKESNVETNSEQSEKEIRCHSYNIQSRVEFKAVDDKTESSKDVANTNKGAQAYFSNDSIEDYLSERGMTCLGENSFLSHSSFTDLTSKPSKNNILKNVLSYLSKSKISTASDPGVKKAKSKNLELLHLCHSSISSSSSDLKNVKGLKVVKESRSTF